MHQPSHHLLDTSGRVVVMGQENASSPVLSVCIAVVQYLEFGPAASSLLTPTYLPGSPHWRGHRTGLDS
ncbi:hypothetical protein O3P69_018519 [Scylla paramamosain]|uniref:Uncharacterized protein n=1 Tax=Scylla paramamosain TaxID=85552 RepID=A0AAW0T2N2_SCYPA